MQNLAEMIKLSYNESTICIILYIIATSIVAILSFAGILFFYLLADIKIQHAKLKRLKIELSKQEISILVLSARVIKLMEAVSVYIEEIEKQRLTLQNKRRSYLNLTKHS